MSEIIGFGIDKNVRLLLQSVVSNFHKQELLFVLGGLKSVCRQGKYDDELDPFFELMKDIGLSVVVSPFKVIPLQQSGYTEGGLRVSLDDRRSGMRFVYVSRDELSANLACYYDLILDDSQLGLLLGYPTCCVDYFKNHFSCETVDLSLVGYEPLIDISLRSEGFCLLSHFPCSSTCAQSLRIASDVFVFLEKYWPERAMLLKKKLDLSGEK